MKTIKTTLKLFAILMVVVGVIYPVAVTVLAQLIFPKEAGGSLIYDSGGKSHRFSTYRAALFRPEIFLVPSFSHLRLSI